MRMLPIVVVIISAAHAAADPVVRTAALDPPGLTPETDGKVTDPKRALDDVVARDAAADRGAILDTALTLPRGAVGASARVVTDGGLATASAGLATGLEVIADVGKMFASRSMTYGGTLKVAVVRRPMWQIAVEATYRHVAIDCGDCIDDGRVLSGGALVSGCLDAQCVTVATVGAGIVISDDDNDVGQAVTAGLVSGSGALRLLGEAAWIGNHGVGFLGGRFGGDRLAVDAGAAATIDSTNARIQPLIGVSGRL